MGGRPGQRAAGHSQLVADGDERHEEEGRERAEVLDGERLLVRVVEREVLHGGRSVGRSVDQVGRREVENRGNRSGMKG